MPDTHASRLSACALALSFVLSATLANGQPTLDAARRLYLSAEYDESLTLLGQLHGGTTAEQNEIAAYRLFCLVALGRNDEAARTVSAIVSADPFYQLPEDMASPRISDVFRHTRRKTLPDIARREYAAAKLAFDRKDPSSSAMFDRVLELLADPDLDAPVEGDLKVLAEGFRDLSRSFVPPPAAAAPSQPPASDTRGTAGRIEGSTGATTTVGSTTPASTERRPAPSTAAPASAAVDPATLRPAREGDPGVIPPVVVSQTLPRWSPPAGGAERLREFEGVIEVVIDTQGSVVAATMRASVHPQYDPELLRTARSWKFKPAMKNGRPVAYTKLVEVRLRPAAR